jgi:hypothetical protein
LGGRFCSDIDGLFCPKKTENRSNKAYYQKKDGNYCPAGYYQQKGYILIQFYLEKVYHPWSKTIKITRWEHNLALGLKNLLLGKKYLK